MIGFEELTGRDKKILLVSIVILVPLFSIQLSQFLFETPFSPVNIIPVFMGMIMVCSPLVLLWLALWQYRRTDNRFFLLLTAAYALEILALVMNYLEGYVFLLASSKFLEVSRTINQICMLLGELIRFSSLGVLIYALLCFAASNRVPTLRLNALKGKDLLLLLVLTVILLFYVLTPMIDGLRYRMFISAPLEVISQILFVVLKFSPLILLWLTLCQYRSTGNSFFWLLTLSSAVEIISVLINGSSYYLRASGVLEQNTYRFGLSYLLAILGLIGFGITAYALAAYRETGDLLVERDNESNEGITESES